MNDDSDVAVDDCDDEDNDDSNNDHRSDDNSRIAILLIIITNDTNIIFNTRSLFGHNYQSVICVCITRAMTPCLHRTRHGISRGSSTPTASNMPCLAEEHADVQENSYVTAIVDSAWSEIMDRQHVAQNPYIRTAWANARLLSLARIKQHIMRETHEPVTLEALLHAEPSQTKHQKRSWKCNVDSISRCIAAYHHAISAAEHDLCRSIQQDICAYA